MSIILRLKREKAMEMAAEMKLEAREIDLLYEYDAAMYYDFTREESPAEAYEAEQWFNTAPCNSPSVFAKKLLLREERELTKVRASSKPTLVKDIELEPKQKSRFKEYVPKSSNLMKPTASSLAKQNPRVIRIPKSFTSNKPTTSLLAKQNHPLNGASSRSQMPAGGQAAKKQKLERGDFHKVEVATQQHDLVHKVYKMDELIKRSTTRPKSRVPFTKEPKLATANWEEMKRLKNNLETETAASNVRKFKAHTPPMAPQKRIILKFGDSVLREFVVKNMPL